MRKYILIILICSWLGCGHFLFAQEVEWVKKNVSTNPIELGQLQIGINGDIFFSQAFRKDTLLAIGDSIYDYSDFETANFFLARLNKVGELKDVQFPKCRNKHSLQGLVVDKQNNRFVIGEHMGLIIFDTLVLNKKGYGMFLLKYDSLDKLKWAYPISGGNTRGTALAEDGNAIYASGFCYGSVIMNGDTVSGTVFLLKMDKDGNNQWFKVINGTVGDSHIFNRLMSLSASVDKGVVLASNIGSAGVLKIDSITLVANERDIAVVKLDTLGNLNWAKIIGGIKSDLLNEVKLVDEVVYVSGYTEGYLYYGEKLIAQDATSFVLALSVHDGKLLWIKKYGKGGGFPTLASTKGNIVVCLDFYDTLYSDQKTYIAKRSNLPHVFSSADIYTDVLNSDGKTLMDFQIGGGGGEEFPIIAADSSNNFYILSCATGETEILGNSFIISPHGSFLAKISLPILGVSGNSNTLQASVYPNPAALGKVSINFNLKKYGAINLGVTDINGKKMQEDILKFFAQGENNFTINANNYPNGKYFCSLQHDGITETISFVIQK